MTRVSKIPDLTIKRIRGFIKTTSFKVLILSILMLNPGNTFKSSCQRLSRDLNVDLLVNQAGFVPHARKTVVTKGITTGKFEVIDLLTKNVVYAGVFKPDPGDFGDYSIGDFSAIMQEGHYYIRSDTLRSYPFAISGTVYNPAMKLIVGYFSLQRCGSSTTGYMTPCHLDD